MASFLALYSPAFASLGAFDSWVDLANALPAPFSHLPGHSTHAYLVGEKSLNPSFVNEIVAVAARVNYGQDVDELHSLAGMVSLAPENAVSVRGGNRQIFEQFIINSGADVKLGAEVQSIAKLHVTGDARPKWTVTYADVRRHSKLPPTATAAQTFDAVILAAPRNLSGIEILNSPASGAIPYQDYVHLHVTFIATNASTPRGDYFGLQGTKGPRTALSTMMPSKRKGAGWRPEFNSLSNLFRYIPHEERY